MLINFNPEKQQSLRQDMQLNSYLNQAAAHANTKVPIYKGCPNKSCFCTGACRQILGYRDKVPGEY
jgi:hypothetical protein